MMGKYPIERFIEAQKKDYEQALKELRNGKKVGHWMWYIFPQLRSLGKSEYAQYYGIENAEEAKDYCDNSVLYDRYIECCNALESLQNKNIVYVLGEIDSKKLRSSLTLFYIVDEKNKALYKKLIDKFYDGKWDNLTIDQLMKNN